MIRFDFESFTQYYYVLNEHCKGLWPYTMMRQILSQNIKNKNDNFQNQYALNGHTDSLVKN